MRSQLHLGLVEDDTDYGWNETWGNEIEFRTALCESLRKRFFTPAVLLVVHGGVGTLRTVLAAMKKNFSILLLASSSDALERDSRLEASGLLAKWFKEKRETLDTKSMEHAIKSISRMDGESRAVVEPLLTELHALTIRPFQNITVLDLQNN